MALGITWLCGLCLKCGSKLASPFLVSSLPFQTLRWQHLTSSAGVSTDPRRGHWSTQSRPPFRTDVPPSPKCWQHWLLQAVSWIPAQDLALTEDCLFAQSHVSFPWAAYIEWQVTQDNSEGSFQLWGSWVWLKPCYDCIAVHFSLCPVLIYLTCPQVPITGTCTPITKTDFPGMWPVKIINPGATRTSWCLGKYLRISKLVSEMEEWLWPVAMEHWHNFQLGSSSTTGMASTFVLFHLNKPLSVGLSWLWCIFMLLSKRILRI